jgi:hypothetical protein
MYLISMKLILSPRNPYLIKKVHVDDVLQVFASILAISICVGFPGLYATLVCVACSQLEKLRAALLSIRQTYITSQQQSLTETGQQEGQGEGHASEDMFRHMHRQLNNCIRHHQDIKRCVYNQVKCHLLCITVF